MLDLATARTEVDRLLSLAIQSPSFCLSEDWANDVLKLYNAVLAAGKSASEPEKGEEWDALRWEIVLGSIRTYRAARAAARAATASAAAPAPEPAPAPQEDAAAEGVPAEGALAVAPPAKKQVRPAPPAAEQGVEMADDFTAQPAPPPPQLAPVAAAPVAAAPVAAAPAPAGAAPAPVASVSAGTPTLRPARYIHSLQEWETQPEVRAGTVRAASEEEREAEAEARAKAKGKGRARDEAEKEEDPARGAKRPRTSDADPAAAKEGAPPRHVQRRDPRAPGPSSATEMAGADDGARARPRKRPPPADDGARARPRKRPPPAAGGAGGGKANKKPSLLRSSLLRLSAQTAPDGPAEERGDAHGRRGDDDPGADPGVHDDPGADTGVHDNPGADAGVNDDDEAKDTAAALVTAVERDPRIIMYICTYGDRDKAGNAPRRDEEGRTPHEDGYAFDVVDGQSRCFIEKLMLRPDERGTMMIELLSHIVQPRIRAGELFRFPCERCILHGRTCFAVREAGQNRPRCACCADAQKKCSFSYALDLWRYLADVWGVLHRLVKDTTQVVKLEKVPAKNTARAIRLFKALGPLLGVDGRPAAPALPTKGSLYFTFKPSDDGPAAIEAKRKACVQALTQLLQDERSRAALKMLGEAGLESFGVVE